MGEAFSRSRGGRQWRGAGFGKGATALQRHPVNSARSNRFLGKAIQRQRRDGRRERPNHVNLCALRVSAVFFGVRVDCGFAAPQASANRGLALPGVYSSIFHTKRRFRRAHKHVTTSDSPFSKSRFENSGLVSSL